MAAGESKPATTGPLMDLLTHDHLPSWVKDDGSKWFCWALGIVRSHHNDGLLRSTFGRLAGLHRT